MADADSAAAANADETTGPPAERSSMSRVRRATVLGLLLVSVLVGVTAWLGFRAIESRGEAIQRDRFLAVGEQLAINLNTIAWERVDEDVQRVLDLATGAFYAEFDRQAPKLKDEIRQTKWTTVGTVVAGLESATDTDGYVLAAVSVQESKAGVAQPGTRSWRMRIRVQEVGGEAKVSNVEYVA